MSGGNLFVTGKRVCFPVYRRGPVPVGEFSNHWAAVAAFVRLRHPEFRSLGGDKPEDLAEEVRMAAKIASIHPRATTTHQPESKRK